MHVSNEETSCYFPENLEQKDPWKTTENRRSRSTIKQLEPPASVLVGDTMETPLSEHFLKPFKMCQRESPLFPNVKVEINNSITMVCYFTGGTARVLFTDKQFRTECKQDIYNLDIIRIYNEYDT